MRYLALALPSIAVTVALAVIACSETAGGHALTFGEPRSVSEAIAMRDTAGAARLVESGTDVNAIGLIRAGVLSDRPVLATPAETAVLVDGAVALDFLTTRGAAVSDVQLACLALDAGANAVRRHLSASPQCQPGRALQAVLARP